MDRRPVDVLPQELARLAVEAFVREGTIIKPPVKVHGVLAVRAGTFVTLQAPDARLRGCIGTIEPAHANVAEEIVQNAISAAIRDPRFSPVSTTELPLLRYSVDVLSKPEPARGLEDLDPSIFGVIIETLDGMRRGLLLPRIGGLESAEEQWRMVHLKAGITPGTLVRVQRFSVTRFGKA